MGRFPTHEDIKPLSEFQANAESLIERIRETRRPLVLTQRGHSIAVVLSAAEYEIGLVMGGVWTPGRGRWW